MNRKPGEGDFAEESTRNVGVRHGKVFTIHCRPLHSLKKLLADLFTKSQQP